jgi:hypothetical protein
MRRAPMRHLASMVTWFISASGSGFAQETATEALSTTTNTQPAVAQEPEGKAWSFSASAFTYLVPESREYVQPTIAADRRSLHLEARYNYEALDTVSTWIGYNFSFGDKLALEFTPMLGGVFGDTYGVAPGYKFALSWWKLELSGEGEYLFNTDGWSDSFFYTWSELALAPVDWFRFGLAVQRTKVYHTDFEVQRGFLVGLSYKKVDFTTYVFDPDASRPTIVLGVGISF